MGVAEPHLQREAARLAARRRTAALSMPEGTVKVRLHRARRQLERVLADEE